MRSRSGSGVSILQTQSALQQRQSPTILVLHNGFRRRRQPARQECVGFDARSVIRITDRPCAAVQEHRTKSEARRLAAGCGRCCISISRRTAVHEKGQGALHRFGRLTMRKGAVYGLLIGTLLVAGLAPTSAPAPEIWRRALPHPEFIHPYRNYQLVNPHRNLDLARPYHSYDLGNSYHNYEPLDGEDLRALRRPEVHRRAFGRAIREERWAPFSD